MVSPASQWPANVNRAEAIVLFDGVCSLCNRAIQVIIRLDRNGQLRLAALQSASGRALWQWCGRPPDDFDTIAFIEDGRVYLRSTAVLRIAGHLPWPWPIASVAMVIPTFIRDWCYDCVAKNRYRLFGRKDQCMMPTADLKKRFLP